MKSDGNFDTKTSLLGGLVAEIWSVDHGCICIPRAAEWLIIMGKYNANLSPSELVCGSFVVILYKLAQKVGAVHK